METHRVHRIMFYNLEPKAITSISYDSFHNLIAVLRVDNRIEIWDVNGVPFIQSTILLKPQTKLRGIVWGKKRLFGSDLEGFVKEMDLVHLREKNSYPVSSGGPCHCLAVDKPNKPTLLAVGTELGFINIFSIEKNGLSFVKLIQSKYRILSICWDVSGDYIVTSGVKTIKMFNYTDGRLKHVMKPSQSSKKQNVVIWSVVITDDFTVIAGDSSGTLSMWDGKTGVCTYSIKCLQKDVLTVCLSRDHKTVYCAGIDPDIKSFCKTELKNKIIKWVRSREIINHSHDVNSLIQLKDGRFCSGGVDSYLTISRPMPYSVLLYPPLIQNPVIYVAIEARYIMFRYSTHLELWYLKDISPEKSQYLLYSDLFIKIVELRSNNNELIRCAAISNDGNFIFYATNTTARIFRFSFNDDDPKLLPLSLSDCKLENVYHVCFSTDNNRLFISDNTNLIQVFSLLSEDLPLLYDVLLTNESKIPDSTISLLATTNNGDYVAVAKCNGVIGIWKKSKFHGFLPKSSFAVTAMTFHPHKNILCAMYSDFTFVEYSLDKLRFTEFSKSFDSNLLDKYLSPKSLPVTNITFDYDKDHIIILHTSSTIFIIDKNKVIPVKHQNKKMKLDVDSEKLPFKRGQKEKQYPRRVSPVVNLQSYFGSVPISENDLAEDAGCHVYERYQHLVHFENIGSKEMIAVEIKPKQFLERLPPLLKKKKFGQK